MINSIQDNKAERDGQGRDYEKYNKKEYKEKEEKVLVLSANIET